MFMIEIVEGKDQPNEMGKPQYEELGESVGLLLCLLASYFHTARYVVLDYGFCVLKVFIELRRNGIFGCALIKKRG